VGIGILIALQINNWNESKKQEKNKNTIYKKKAAANTGNRCTRTKKDIFGLIDD
jgi:hypothetical protein